jgi:signal transduction histidine kinase
MGRTKILYGADKAVGMGIKFMENVKKRMDSTFDWRGASIVVEIDAYWNGYLDMRERGAEIRVITEITESNISYCKQLMKIAEVRHLNGMIGGIAMNETEYMATTTLQEAKPLTQVIYSDVEEVVRQGQALFQMLWENSLPADDRIREIEEGVEPEKTWVLYGVDNVVNYTLDCFSSVKETLDECTNSNGPSIFLDNAHLRAAYSSLKDKGLKLRFLTEITEGNISYCKQLMKIAEVRHLDKVKGNFGIADKSLYLASKIVASGQAPSSIIISSTKSFVEQQQYFFETLWEKAIDAHQRIQQLEKGIEQEYIETITDPTKVASIGAKLIRSATDEIRILFSTPNAFHRQERNGLVELLKDVSKRCQVKIRILTPFDEKIQELEAKLEKEASYMQGHQISSSSSSSKNFDIRPIEPALQTKISLLITDTKFSLAVELEDDTKQTTAEAIGLATLSNSHATVFSYISMFETMWMQNALHEKLKAHGRMQQEFINVAAHELRSPIQPIIGLSEVLYYKTTNDQQRELVNIIRRNAKRLQNLAENILDVSRVESHTLKLSKELFDLSDLVAETVNDYKDGIESQYNNQLQFYVLPALDQCEIFVEADKERIRQVIRNLLNNAVEFTKSGTIYIRVGKRQYYGSQFAFVSIRDTGPGIASEIFSVMFEKFTSKSEKGTGLGLFISKAIVEAHGGSIWGKNNRDNLKDDDISNAIDEGATFTFTLPMTTQQRQQLGRIGT